ncbi:hypothetical protein GGR56DRAFT_91474 [Xylariaceae sp. FL0804]|nr:hypothetical protein GGR56DRAFT_91474 [Xylariaceae sp. FL0804]
MSRALFLSTLLPSAAALLVAPGSPCETSCGNVLSATTPDMIVCDDTAYASSSSGQVFQSCITCESTSTYSTTSGDRNVSDLQYMLYNMRYATNQCVFEADTPCSTSRACGSYLKAIQYANLSDTATAYGFCSLWDDFFLDQCRNCLLVSEDFYTDNFVGVLDGACRLLLQPPATLPFQGSIFANDQLNVTNPTPTATFAPDSAGPLNNGEIVGVVVGGLAVVLALLGCGVVLNGKRRRKAYLRRRSRMFGPGGGGGTGGIVGGASGGEMFETPVSQRPLNRGWGQDLQDDSPTSAATQTTFPPYFSPYVSQYNSPVSAVEGPHGQGGRNFAAWPSVEETTAHHMHMQHMHMQQGGQGQGGLDPARAAAAAASAGGEIGVAVSPDHDGSETAAGTPWSTGGGGWKGKEKEREREREREAEDGYELQEGVGSAGGFGFPAPPPPTQAPTLGHPGYGRYGPAMQMQRAPSWEEEYSGDQSQNRI